MTLPAFKPTQRLANVCCDECWNSWITGVGTEAEVRAWVEEALDEGGWTTDGIALHCPDCPNLEISGVQQAAAMVSGKDLLASVVKEQIDLSDSDA